MSRCRCSHGERKYKRKYDLREVRTLKKSNHNKEKNRYDPDYKNRTGLRIQSSYDYTMNMEYIENKKLSDVPNPLSHYDRCYWVEMHPNQIMESDIHDRTRWESSKKKTQKRNVDRYNKIY